MTQGMSDCIVSYFDLPGVQDLEREEAARLMDLFHHSARTAMQRLIDGPVPAHQHMYCWNDSCLCWPPLDTHDEKKVMAEVNSIRSSIRQDLQGHVPYVISVKGRSFPGPLADKFVGNPGNGHQSCFVFLKASSYAMKNCLDIEHTLGKHRKQFYVDSRIVDSIGWNDRGTKRSVVMLPDKSARDVHMYDSLPL